MGIACAILGIFCAVAPAPDRSPQDAIIIGAPHGGYVNWWLTINQNAPPSEWQGNFCDADGKPSGAFVPLGNATLPGPMRGQFIYAPSITKDQREYIDHWIALARHCEASPDDSACSEVWNPPCKPCDEESCPKIM
jgi:hypothetical protein